MYSHPKRILVVDDDELLLEIIKTSLESEGFSVSAAKEGKTAIENFNRFKPDLVILDIKLPGLSGHEVLQNIRKLSNIPIIILTGVIESDMESLTKQLGADDYIRKPFIPLEMVARVRATLRRAAKN